MTIQDGIFVHAEKDIYYVFFDQQDNSKRKYYNIGELIREITDKEACWITSVKVSNSVHNFPFYDQPFSEQLMGEGYEWMCGFMDEDEDYPVAMEIGRASLHKIFIVAACELGDILNKITIGEFMEACAAEHTKALKDVFLTIGAITYDDTEEGLLEPPEDEIPEGWNTVTPDERKTLAKDFWERVGEVSDTWGGKHKNQKSRSRCQDERVVRVIQLITPMDILVFEQCRIQRENRKLKRCQNCGNVFLTGKRIDEKYCEGSSPGNPDKTCREVGGMNRRKLKRRTDPELQERERAYARDRKEREKQALFEKYR